MGRLNALTATLRRPFKHRLLREKTGGKHLTIFSYRIARHLTPQLEKPQLSLCLGEQSATKSPTTRNRSHIHLETQSINGTISKKRLAKNRYDTKHKAKPHNFKVGNEVLTTNVSNKRNKTTPKWNTKPGTVVKIKGNSLIIQQGAKQIMRSANQSKQYKSPVLQTPPPPAATADSSSSDDDYFSYPVRDQPDQSNSNRNEEVDDSSFEATIPYNVEENEEPLFVPRPQRTRQIPKKLNDYELT